MCEGKQRDAWERHSLLIAAIINTNRAPGSRPVHPSVFNPFAPKPREKTFDELFPPNLIPTS